MKTLRFVLCCLLLSSAVAALPAAQPSKPDYLTYHADGSVKTRGVYQTDANGRVVKFTVYDGAGRLLSTEVPYYAGDGRMLRGDHFDAAGKLAKVVVYFDTFATVLDSTGKVIDQQAFAQPDLPKGAK